MKVSIIILTYNQLPLTKQCLDSLRKHTNKEEIELIVVDNGSSDGTVDYLKSQPDIKLIRNKHNVGFAKGCNQGGEVATGDYILFLNNDTVVTKNWLAPMLGRLASDERLGMIGPISNYVSGQQQIPVPYTQISQVDKFAEQIQKENAGKTKKVLRLVGFCLLAKRIVLDEIGWFDEDFELGSFEDDDLCIRALQQGYQLAIALDSFVHHHGHATFTGNQDLNINHLFHVNQQRFIDKWQTNLTYYTHPRPEIVNLVPTNAKRILDVGCAAGATGLELLNRQDCEMYGIELNSLAASLARSHYQEVQSIDVETTENEYPESFFDTIIFADVLEHLKDPWQVIKRCNNYLKPGGSMVVSLPNIAHAEALLPLLQGNWNYVDAGILDRTHLRFFTPNTVHTLFPSEQFTIHSQAYTKFPVDPKVQIFFTEVTHLGKKFGFELDHLSEYATRYQILFRVEKVESGEKDI
ncbi:glycosyltransferase [Rossellomorea yichunensis]|uniref:glycosyltransferase n=1 Tax=Rossellomorea yichunensis TaxID=3077331 RepID=UPI0028DF4CFC|nr:glycosyltransferase [Rossellomorea sp. YC4-1]MDT9027896.1 glycosyltransferase [Rossellomorea sp. YC4-1]